jgi:hypothetical protein
MANTYVALAKNVLTSTQTSITFSSIPSTYTDLVLVYSARDNSSGNTRGGYTIRINSNSGSIYSYTALVKDDTNAAISYRGSSQDRGYWGLINGSASTANTFGNGEFYIPNYAGATRKIFSVSEVTENNNASSTGINATGANINDTNAISSITFFSFTTDCATGSSFYLYGIKNS